MIRFTADEIRAACEKPLNVSKGVYETRGGTQYRGLLVSHVPAALRDAGHRRVGRIDQIDLREVGVMTVEAQYIGGARPTGKFVSIVVLGEFRGWGAQK